MNPHYSLVATRAAYRCEYCRAPESVFNFEFHVEHIHPQSLGGDHNPNNLALACTGCNLFKSNATSGFDEITNSVSPLFNPRVDRWVDHFAFDDETGSIVGITPVGRVTVERLQMNRLRQLVARRRWIVLGLFP